MVRNAIRLMEILSFLYMVAAVYNVKMKYNIYSVVLVVLELLLLTGINNLGFSSYFLGFSYLLMFIYCLVNYKSSIKRTIVNFVIASVSVSLIEVLCYIAISFIDMKFTITVQQKELGTSILYFIIIILLGSKLRLQEISDFFLKRNKLLYITGIFILIILANQMLGIKKVQFTASSGRHSVLERPFSEANGRPFVS